MSELSPLDALLQPAFHDELRIVGEIDPRDLINHVSKKPKNFIGQNNLLFAGIHSFPIKMGPLPDSI